MPFQELQSQVTAVTADSRCGALFDIKTVVDVDAADEAPRGNTTDKYEAFGDCFRFVSFLFGDGTCSLFPPSCYPPAQRC